MSHPPAPGGLSARRGRALLQLAMLVLGLVVGGVVMRSLGAAPGTEWVDRFVLGQGPLGEAIFLVGGAAATAAGVPRQAVAFLGGYAFGAALGSVLSVLATLAGAAISFGWARLVARDWAARRLSGRFGRGMRALRDTLIENPFGAALALRLLPVGNNLALNLLAGMSGVALLPFLAGSAFGYLPQTVVFALLGKGVRVDGAWQLGLSALLLAISLIIGFWLLRRHRVARALDAEAPPQI